MAERLGWILAIVLCVILPAALGYYGLALAGRSELAMLWWRLRRNKLKFRKEKSK